MNQIISLIMRLFGRQIMNSALKRFGKSGAGTGRRQASLGIQNTIKNSQKAMKILRRLR